VIVLVKGGEMKVGCRAQQRGCCGVGGHAAHQNNATLHPPTTAQLHVLACGKSISTSAISLPRSPQPT
jgi:hypothetical protein